VGVIVGVHVRVGVVVGGGVCVAVGVAVAVAVAVLVRLGVTVGVKVAVSVLVAVGVGGSAVGVPGPGVSVMVGVVVGLGVSVGVGGSVGVLVGVAVELGPGVLTGLPSEARSASGRKSWLVASSPGWLEAVAHAAPMPSSANQMKTTTRTAGEDGLRRIDVNSHGTSLSRLALARPRSDDSGRPMPQRLKPLL
jgi:hypothetical protein